jgi:hypothetical protein
MRFLRANPFWVAVAIILIWAFTLWLAGNVGWHMGWNAHG